MHRLTEQAFPFTIGVKGDIKMTNEEAMRWLEQFTDAEVEAIYALIKQIEHMKEPVPFQQGTDGTEAKPFQS